MESLAYAAVVLAGGGARRLAGVSKPALPVAGRPMLHRVLAAVEGASARVVVGPADLPVPDGVLITREEPPGTGPVAGTAAGLERLPAGIPAVALLAGDLPLLDAAALATLRAALVDEPGSDTPPTQVAVFVDERGHRQSLCAVWRTGALRAALGRLVAARGTLADAPVRALFDGVPVVEVSWSGAGPPPWFDCDTEADLRQAEEWSR